MLNAVTRLHYKSVGLTISLGLIALAAGTQANAACMDSISQPGLPGDSSRGAHFVPAVYRPGEVPEGLLLASDTAACGSFS